MYYAGLPFLIDPTTSSNGQYLMSGEGMFFGPQAAEVGLVFNITQTAGSGMGSGVMVGKRN